MRCIMNDDDSEGREHHYGIYRWYGITLIALAVLAVVTCS
jgi:hypothetical protein